MSLTKKQNQVYKYIYQYYYAKGVPPTQTEIKEHFGLRSLGSVQQYLKYLKESGYIVTEWNQRRGIFPQVDLEISNPKNFSIVEVPLLGHIAAGNPLAAIENPTESIDVPQFMIPKTGKFFALKVNGDSMIEEGIKSHDLIVAKVQNVANRGDIIVAIVNNEATLKYYYPEMDKIELRAANTNYDPIIVYPEENFVIAGVLHSLFRSYA
ncbi:MAG: transcriptional repressor LexA [Bacteriovoracaceae bacterium]